MAINTSSCVIFNKKHIIWKKFLFPLESGDPIKPDGSANICIGQANKPKFGQFNE